MILWPNGLGGVTGDILATTKPLYTSEDVWFVNSNGGVDAAAPAGKDRQKPLATVGQAYTNAGAHDIIVLMDGHTETRTSSLSVVKALTFVGEGSASGVPTVQLKINAAAASFFTVVTSGNTFANLKFPASLQSNTGDGGNQGKLAIQADTIVRGCYFEQSGLDQLPAISIASGSTDVRIENTTIISTATAVATRPPYGIYHIGTATDLDVVGLTLSDGTVGFSTAAWDGTAGAVTRLRATGISLLLGADVRQHASTVGYLYATTQTGGASVNW